MKNNNNRYDECGRQELESGIGDWIERIMGNANDEESILAEKRMLDLLSEESDAKRGTSVIEQGSYELSDNAKAIETNGALLLQLSKGKEKSDHRKVVVQYQKKTQTGISFNNSLDSHTEQGTNKGRDAIDDVRQFQEALTMETVIQQKNSHILELLNKLDSKEIRHQETTTLLTSEIKLREELVKRMKEEMDVVTTGIGFTADWGAPVENTVPEFDIDKIMHELRAEIRDQSRDDRSKIRQQQQHVQELKGCIEALKLNSTRVLAAHQTKVNDLISEKEELERELQEREELLSIREHKITTQKEEIDEFNIELEVYHKARKEAEDEVLQLAAEIKQLKEEAKGLITQKQLNTLLEEERHRIDTVRRFKDAELKETKSTNKELSLLLKNEKSQHSESRRSLEEATKLIQQQQKTSAQHISAFKTDLTNVISTAELIRQASCFELNLPFRKSVWSYTAAMLEHLLLGFSNPSSHIHCIDLENTTKRVLSLEFKPPTDPSLEKISDLQLSLAASQRTIDDHNNDEGRFKSVFQNSKQEQEYVGDFTEKIRVLVGEILESTTLHSVFNLTNPIPGETVRKNIPSDRYQILQESFKPVINEWAMIFTGIKDLKLDFLKNKRELVALTKKLSQMADASRGGLESNSTNEMHRPTVAIKEVGSVALGGIRTSCRALAHLVTKISAKIPLKMSSNLNISKRLEKFHQQDSIFQSIAVRCLFRRCKTMAIQSVKANEMSSIRKQLWSRHEEATQQHDVQAASTLLAVLNANRRQVDLQREHFTEAATRDAVVEVETGLKRASNLMAAVSFVTDVFIKESDRNMSALGSSLNSENVGITELRDKIVNMSSTEIILKSEIETLQEQVKALEEKSREVPCILQSTSNDIGSSLGVSQPDKQRSGFDFFTAVVGLEETPSPTTPMESSLRTDTLNKPPDNKENNKSLPDAQVKPNIQKQTDQSVKRYVKTRTTTKSVRQKRLSSSTISSASDMMEIRNVGTQTVSYVAIDSQKVISRIGMSHAYTQTATIHVSEIRNDSFFSCPRITPRNITRPSSADTHYTSGNFSVCEIGQTVVSELKDLQEGDILSFNNADLSRKKLQQNPDASIPNFKAELTSINKSTGMMTLRFIAGDGSRVISVRMIGGIEKHLHPYPERSPEVRISRPGTGEIGGRDLFKEKVDDYKNELIHYMQSGNCRQIPQSRPSSSAYRSSGIRQTTIPASLPVVSFPARFLAPIQSGEVSGDIAEIILANRCGNLGHHQSNTPTLRDVFSAPVSPSTQVDKLHETITQLPLTIMHGVTFSSPASSCVATAAICIAVCGRLQTRFTVK